MALPFLRRELCGLLTERGREDLADSAVGAIGLTDDGGTISLSEIETALGSNRSVATPTLVVGNIQGTIEVSIGGVLRIGFAQAGASGTPSVVTKHARFTIQEIP